MAESALEYEEAAIRKHQASEEVEENILAIDIYGFTMPESKLATDL